jgi:uncharacterized membrane protein YdjX (TVP38/TMEM64 family)
MRFFLVCLALVALFIGSYLVWGDRFESLLAGKEAVAWLRSWGLWAWLVAIALMMADIILPIPATAVLATLGIVYGPVVGGLIGCAGSMLAGSVGYLACRAMGRRAAVWMLGESGFEKSHAFFVRSGGWTVALSRWMIILPEMVSCLAGLTRMPARLYFTALACGTVPMCFAYAWIGHAESDRPVLALSLSAAAPVLLWPVMQMSARFRK